MILKLTTLAWNVTVLDPIEQEEMLDEIADPFHRRTCCNGETGAVPDRQGVLALADHLGDCRRQPQTGSAKRLRSTSARAHIRREY
jgi:hypothetical protein